MIIRTRLLAVSSTALAGELLSDNNTSKAPCCTTEKLNPVVASEAAVLLPGWVVVIVQVEPREDPVKYEANEAFKVEAIAAATAEAEAFVAMSTLIPSLLVGAGSLDAPPEVLNQI